LLASVHSGLLASVALLVFVPMGIEAIRASRNERRQLARGGVEAPDDVHGVMSIAYPGSFLAMLIEGAFRGTPPLPVFAVGLIVFASAKLVKWAAIVALGRSWTFRVIVVPGDSLVAVGPYRYLRHPNYVGVVGEFVGTALMTGAMLTGPVALLGFGILLWKRIAVEERALERARR
jgi:methyltransferase